MATKTGIKRKTDVSPKLPTKVGKNEERLEDFNKRQLIERYKSLGKKYDILVKEKYLIDNKCQSLENKTTEGQKETVQTQTESDDNDIEIACKVCIY